MCYDIQAKLESQLKRAIRKNSPEEVNEILEKLEKFHGRPMFHVSGFDHPEMLIYTNDKPDLPTTAIWGLIPHWTQNSAAKEKIWNNTLNAKGETMFEKPSFRDSAISKRCIVHIDGFFEHKHINGKSIPHFIKRIDGKLLSLGGIWSEWINPVSKQVETSFSIITTKANKLMTEIHNNPKLTEPRMPLILNEEHEEDWLAGVLTESEMKTFNKLIAPAPDDILEAHTVGRLSGKNYTGNNASVTNEVKYSAIESGDQLSIFSE